MAAIRNMTERAVVSATTPTGSGSAAHAAAGARAAKTAAVFVKADARVVELEVVDRLMMAPP
jgi:hypothetical protein